MLSDNECHLDSDDYEDVSEDFNLVQFQEFTVTPNPLLVPNILDLILDEVPSTCLFTFRGVCKLWNDVIVTRIIKNRSANVRLLKIVDPLFYERVKPPYYDLKSPCRPGLDPGAINIKEIVVAMDSGRLEQSTCTRIYLNESMELNPTVFYNFLRLNGKKIKVLHYDGNNLEQLIKILKSCAENLESLTLWRLKGPFVKFKEFRFNFPKLKTIVLVSGDDGNFHMSNREEEESTIYPVEGSCNPPVEFLRNLFKASPKLQSLTCRLSGSHIVEALTDTRSFLKLTSLCLKSRVDISQLRSLISAGMDLKLKILRLEGLCVILYDHRYDERYCIKYISGIYPNQNEIVHQRPDPNDPELREFAPLLLEFIKTQANSLEYLSISTFVERKRRPDIPIDEFYLNFPIMPNLTTLSVIISIIGDWITQERFPKLRNVEYYDTPTLDEHIMNDHIPNHLIYELPHLSNRPTDYPYQIPTDPTVNVCHSVKNLRGCHMDVRLAQIFPCVTEFHLSSFSSFNIGILNNIPYFFPRLKHLYYDVNFKCESEETILKMTRIINIFMVGISLEECERVEEEYKLNNFEGLKQVKFVRSQPSIFDLNELETLDFHFSSYEFDSCSGSGGIIPALEILMTWGLSRMKELKKFCYKFEQKLRRGNDLPTAVNTLVKGFRKKRQNVNASTQGYNPLGYSNESQVRKNWSMDLNVNHHISQWNQFNFFKEDPDISDLGFK